MDNAAVLAKKKATEALISSVLNTFTKDTGQLADSIEVESTVIFSGGDMFAKYQVTIAERRHCCFIYPDNLACRQDAKFVATWGQMETDYTEGCGKHIFALVGDADPDKVVITGIEK